MFELSGVRFGWSRVVIFSNAVFDYSFAKYDYGDDVMVIMVMNVQASEVCCMVLPNLHLDLHS